MEQRNVNGESLEFCSIEPLTGFFRDGYTNTSADDFGSHTVCAVVSAEFLEHQRSVGNDLITDAAIRVSRFGAGRSLGSVCWALVAIL